VSSMRERIRGSYDDALYKSTYTLLYYFTSWGYVQGSICLGLVYSGGKCRVIQLAVLPDTRRRDGNSFGGPANRRGRAAPSRDMLS